MGEGGGDAELFAAMIEKYDADNPISRTPLKAGFFAAGVSNLISFAGALGDITDATPEAITTGLETAGVQPLFLAEPSTFDCGEPILDLASSLCSVQAHVVVLDADGDVTEARFYDPTDLFETALSG